MKLTKAGDEFAANFGEELIRRTPATPRFFGSEQNHRSHNSRSGAFDRIAAKLSAAALSQQV